MHMHIYAYAHAHIDSQIYAYVFNRYICRRIDTVCILVMMHVCQVLCLHVSLSYMQNAYTDDPEDQYMHICTCRLSDMTASCFMQPTENQKNLVAIEFCFFILLMREKSIDI